MKAEEITKERIVEAFRKRGIKPIRSRYWLDEFFSDPKWDNCGCAATALVCDTLGVDVKGLYDAWGASGAIDPFGFIARTLGLTEAELVALEVGFDWGPQPELRTELAALAEAASAAADEVFLPTV